MLKELLDWCVKFQDASAEWRRNSWEPQWERWQRNADSIYDPDIAAKKEPWQSTAVWPITASHLENAVAQLYKTEVGPQPPIKFKALVKMPPELDMSQDLQELVIRERDKSGYDLERNKQLMDKATYGSGFSRLRFETVTEDRKVKVPQFEPISVTDPTSIMRAMTGQRQVIGYTEEIQEVVVCRGTKFEHISIWDFFPDPRALKIKGHPCAYRYSTTYGEIVDGVRAGYYLPEAEEALAHIKSEETEEDQGKRMVQADRQISDATVERTKYQANITCFELFARLPKKWVLINGEPIDDPDKLIPAIVRFHKKTVVSVELNDSYDGEPQIYKDDYMVVPGQFYARGISEMLKDVHLVSSETINQRLDAGSQSLTNRYAVIEKYLVDPKDIEDGRRAVRLKAPSGIALTDVKQAIGRLDMGTVDRTSFVEPQEWERIAQERTSITRATLGTSGQVKDANQTLGGQEMLKAATGDKMAYIGMLSEFGFIREITNAYLRLIYQNYTPEDYAEVLGPERAAFFVPMIPEEVERTYKYIPQGIYTMENKAMRQARLAQIDAQFGMAPWFNRVELAKAELQASEEDPAQFILQDAEGMQIVMKAEEMATGMMAQQQAAQEGKPAPKKEPNGQ
jgi:hypothetical protein